MKEKTPKEEMTFSQRAVFEAQRIEDKKELYFKEHRCFGCGMMIVNSMAKFCLTCEFCSDHDMYHKRQRMVVPPKEEWELERNLI